MDDMKKRKNQLCSESLQLEAPPPHGQLTVFCEVPVPGLETMVETRQLTSSMWYGDPGNLLAIFFVSWSDSSVARRSRGWCSTVLHRQHIKLDKLRGWVIGFLLIFL